MGSASRRERYQLPSITYNRTMKVALVYGYAEGPRITRKFSAALQVAGHQLNDAKTADVIIAHSGGSFMIPNNQAKVVLLVNAPYYESHRAMIRNLANRVRQEGIKPIALRKLGWNGWYLVSRPRRARQMQKAVIEGKFPSTEQATVLLIRNADDNFGTPAQDQKLAAEHNWKTITLPGTHDDIWGNPGPYIKLLEELQ